jgi:hypothetical protein
MNMLGNKAPVVKQFLQFAAGFKEDPENYLSNMLKEGKVTQAQVDAAEKEARELLPLIRQFYK